MLTFFGSKQHLCDGVSRRDFLKVGALSVGGLTLADLLRLRAADPSSPRDKAIIMVYLNGGPSHMDMYDLKPNAPVDYRGEFKPIKTNVPGMDICELMPLQAKIADKLAIIRNMKFLQQGHTPPELYTGFLDGNRPSIGSVVSKLRGVPGTLPPYVYLGDANMVGGPGFLGKAHEAYQPGSKADNLGLVKGMTLDRLGQRRELLQTFDTLRRQLDDAEPNLSAVDAYTARALDMVTTNKARDAFDLGKEPDRVREKYGKASEFLLARRLVEAGVPVVSLTPANRNPGPMCNGQWDHHDHIFRCLRGAAAAGPVDSCPGDRPARARPGQGRGGGGLGRDGPDAACRDAAWHGGRPRPLAAVGVRSHGRRRPANGAGCRRHRPPRRTPAGPALHAAKRAGHALSRPRHPCRYHPERPPGPADLFT